MRKAPGWKGVGREPLMDQRERGLESRVHEIAIVGRKLPRQHHSLVDDGADRQRDRVVFQDLPPADRDHAIGDDLANDVEPPLEIALAGEVGGPPNENLLHHWFDRLDAFAKSGIVDRDVAPAEYAQAFGGDDLLDDSTRLLSGSGLARH